MQLANTEPTPQIIDRSCLYDKGCTMCPRLVDFRNANKAQIPQAFNAPVDSFGSLDASLLVVGLAPGKMGANLTGRPFTGDDAGDFLFKALLKHGYAEGNYAGHANDGVTLKDCRITNAVKCVPPENAPTTLEINQCRQFLKNEIETMLGNSLKTILCLGHVSYTAVMKSLSYTGGKFGHNSIDNVVYDIGYDIAGDSYKVAVHASYHCSRYNTNTKRLTVEMFDDVFNSIKGSN